MYNLSKWMSLLGKHISYASIASGASSGASVVFVASVALVAFVVAVVVVVVVVVVSASRSSLIVALHSLSLCRGGQDGGKFSETEKNAGV